MSLFPISLKFQPLPLSVVNQIPQVHAIIQSLALKFPLKEAIKSEFWFNPLLQLIILINNLFGNLQPALPDRNV